MESQIECGFSHFEFGIEGELSSNYENIFYLSGHRNIKALEYLIKSDHSVC